MKDLLAEASRDVIDGIAWSNVLLVFDFDGTLAPIVPRPDDARMRASTASLLRQVSELYPVAILSGRGRADVMARVAGAPVRAVIGNHGLEPGANGERCRAAVAKWVPMLEAALAAHRGVEVEDKGYSIAVHYRAARSIRRAEQDIRAATAALPGAPRTMGGKRVVNVLPRGAPHKGVALLRLRRELGMDGALYVGDDVTDEDVFAIDDPGRLTCVRVGRSRGSRAPYYVAGQREVDVLLRRLAVARRRMRKHGMLRAEMPA